MINHCNSVNFSYEIFWGNVGIRTQGCWVRSKYASVLCSPYDCQVCNALSATGLANLRVENDLFKLGNIFPKLQILVIPRRHFRALKIVDVYINSITDRPSSHIFFFIQAGSNLRLMRGCLLFIYLFLILFREKIRI